MTSIGAFIDPLPYPDYVERAKVLEEAGFGSAWVSDETIVFGSPENMVVGDVFPTLTMLSANTKSVKIGTGVIDATIRHPAKTAQAIATVDAISNGRLIVGIGAGETVNREMYGIPTDHLFGRMKESLRIIKQLWSSDHSNPTSFSGDFYSLRNAYLKIKPATKPHPPLYVSAFGPATLRLAGEEGDGWLSFSHTPGSFQTVYNGIIREAAEKAGRTLDSVSPALVIPVAFSDDIRKAESEAAKVAKGWLAWTPDNLKLVAPEARHPGTRHAYIKRHGQAALDECNRIAESIPDEAALSTSVYGNAESCVSKLEAFVKAGCTNFTLYFIDMGVPWAETVREFARMVLPHFSGGAAS